jgi:hypothetical protein
MAIVIASASLCLSHSLRRCRQLGSFSFYVDLARGR